MPSLAPPGDPGDALPDDKDAPQDDKDAPQDDKTASKLALTTLIT